LSCPAAVFFIATLVAPIHTEQNSPQTQESRVRVFLDCAQSDDCHYDYLRDQTPFVDYVRDRGDADVHVLITRADTGARGREHTLSFIGLGRFASNERVLTAVSSATESEERIRQGLATALRIGLLNYVAAAGIPEGLDVIVDLANARQPPAAIADPWKQWIFSLEGNGEIEAEESTRERQFSVSAGADRITPDWKITMGVEFSQNREEFDLDEEEPFSSTRHERQFNWLLAKGLGQHWSVGALGEARSSTFDNLAFSIEGGPAIEWNFFPYAMYTRRQLRVLYSLGAVRSRYHEETLFEKLAESRGVQQLSTTYEQREQWGTLEGQVEWRNYLPGVDLNRASVEGEVTLRIVRGLSLSIEGSASRIRDQLSLPRRAATPEEVLLELRQLRSGFETRVQFGITYQFGSALASIVNPRFGQ
jgi:hypothetical protein